MLTLDRTAPTKRTPARHSALLATACAAALLIASPAMAQQLTTGGAGAGITNITTDGNGTLTIGGATATAADGRVVLNNAAGASRVILDANSGNIVGTGTLSVGAANVASTLDVTGATALGALTTSGQVLMNSTLTATGTVNAGNINILSGDIVNNAGDFTTTNGNFTTANGTVSSATLSTTGAATIGSTLDIGGAGSDGLLTLYTAGGVDRVILDGAAGTIVGTGDIFSTGGSVTAGFDITAQSGNISATLGNVTADNGLVRGGTLESLGATNVGGTLSVGTDATIGGTLGVTGATTLGSTLNVVGLTTTAGITNVGAITNTGAINNTGSLTVNAGGNSFQVNGASGVTASAGAGALDINTTSTTVGFGSNGMVANADSLVLTGGTASTTMTLNDSGASFANTAGGAPVTVTGVANGTSQFDAVNYGQLSSLENTMSAGIASIAAIANIPAPPSGKRFALGGAVGGFNGETAFAIGGTANVTTEVVVKASVGFSGGETAFGAGAAYAW